MNERPREAMLVFVEQTTDATDLCDANHPERAIYILGAEIRCPGKLSSDTKRCRSTAHVPECGHGRLDRHV